MEKRTYQIICGWLLETSFICVEVHTSGMIGVLTRLCVGKSVVIIVEFLELHIVIFVANAPLWWLEL